MVEIEVYSTVVASLVSFRSSAEFQAESSGKTWWMSAEIDVERVKYRMKDVVKMVGAS